MVVTTIIDHAPADLWIVPLVRNVLKVHRCSTSVKISSLVDQWDYGGAADRDRFCPMAITSGGTTPVFIVSSDTRVGGLRPWNLIEGSLADLVPGAVAIDQSYFARLGTKGLGASAEIRDQKVEVTVVTKGIRAFTTTLMSSRPWTRREPMWARHQTKRRISWCVLPPTPTSKASAVDCGQSFPIPKSSCQAAISPLRECVRNWTNAILVESKSGRQCWCVRPPFASVTSLGMSSRSLQ